MTSAAESYGYATALEREVESLRVQLHVKLQTIMTLEMKNEEFEENKEEEEAKLHRRMHSLQIRHEDDMRSYQQNLNDYMENVQKQMNEWEEKLSKAKMEISALNHSQQINMAVIQDSERKIQSAKNDNESLVVQLRQERHSIGFYKASAMPLENEGENEKPIDSLIHTPNKKLSAADNSSPVSVITNSMHQNKLHSTQRELDSLRQWAKKALQKVKFLEQENIISKNHVKKLEKKLEDKIADQEKEVTSTDIEKSMSSNNVNNDKGKVLDEIAEKEKETAQEVITDCTTVSNNSYENISNARDEDTLVENEDVQEVKSTDCEEVVCSSNEDNENMEEVITTGCKKESINEHTSGEADSVIILSDDHTTPNSKEMNETNKGLSIKKIESITTPEAESKRIEIDSSLPNGAENEEKCT